MQQWFLGAGRCARSISPACCLGLLLIVEGGLGGCKSKSHHLDAITVSDVEAHQAISKVEEHLAQKLTQVNLEAEGHDASAESLRQFVSALASSDVQGCPADFKQQFRASLNAWQQVLADADSENTYLRENPREDPDKGGLPSTKTQNLAMQVNLSLQQALSMNQRLRAVAARYEVKWR